MATNKIRGHSSRTTSRAMPGNINLPVVGSQPTQTPEERRNSHLYDDIKDILIDLNTRMEDDNEVYELLDQLDEIKKNAKTKQFELELLETLAWTSNEPAVIEARKNLFSITKLSHYQFLAEAVESWHEDNFMFEGYGDGADTCEEEYVTRYDWINNFSNFIHSMRNRVFRRKAAREQIRQYIHQSQI